jgi:hypothetical protein
MSRRLVGFIITAAGAVLTFIAAAADLIGISSGGSAGMFGKRQIIGTTIGAAMIIAGLVVAFLPRRQVTKHPTGRASEPAATSTAEGVEQVGSAAGPQGRSRATARTVVLLTLVLVVLLVGYAVELTRTQAECGLASLPPSTCDHLPPEAIVVVVLAGVCLVGGLWWAWRVRTGCWGRGARAGKGTVMAERRGHPEAGWVIGLVALVGTLALAFLSWVMFTHPFADVRAGCIADGWSCPGDPQPNVPAGVLCAVLAGGCFVGGLWVSWRVGSGRWSLRRRRTPDGWEGGADAGRRGNPVAASYTLLLTLLVTPVVFFVGTALVGDCFGGAFCPASWWSDWGQPVIPAAICLVFGLWVSWRVGTGHWGLRRRPTEPSPPQA